STATPPPAPSGPGRRGGTTAPLFNREDVIVDGLPAHIDLYIAAGPLGPHLFRKGLRRLRRHVLPVVDGDQRVVGRPHGPQGGQGCRFRIRGHGSHLTADQGDAVARPHSDIPRLAVPHGVGDLRGAH